MQQLGHFEVEKAVEECPEFLVLENFVASEFDELQVVIEKLFARYIFLVQLFFEYNKFRITF